MSFPLASADSLPDTPMLSLMTKTRRNIWIGAVLTLGGLGLAGLFVLFSGIYSVAASRGHFAITAAILEIGMRRSVSLHSRFVPNPPDLSDQNLVRLGAGHYFRGCAFCHGAPGSRRTPIADAMLPPPPELSASISAWTDKQLFWIVRNGLKYTGMPGWPAQSRPDEVWALVAFLKHMPQMREDEYLKLAHGNVTPPPHQAPSTNSLQRAIADCARCHGDETRPPASNLVPRLSGQKEAYLALALEQYATRQRSSGYMQPLAAELDAETRQRLAQYFASLPREPNSPDAASNRAGETIAIKGIPERGIPACVSCHHANAARTFPLLSGQSAAYLRQQLKLFKDGKRSNNAQGAIMTAVARRLTEENIAAVSQYFAAGHSSQEAGAGR